MDPRRRSAQPHENRRGKLLVQLSEQVLVLSDSLEASDRTEHGCLEKREWCKPP
jgi:hypothetical protein